MSLRDTNMVKSKNPHRETIVKLYNLVSMVLSTMFQTSYDSRNIYLKFFYFHKVHNLYRQTVDSIYNKAKGLIKKVNTYRLFLFLTLIFPFESMF